jgi:fatty acid desaturase
MSDARGLLRYRADRRTLAFVGTWYLLAGLGLTLPPSLGLWVILVPVLCALSFLCAIITHNTIHVPIFHNARLNALFQVVLSVTYGHPVSTFVPGHNLSHHQHLQTPRDMMRTAKLRYRWNLLNQLFFGWVVGPPIFKANLDYARAMRTRRPAWFRQLLWETGVYVAVLLAVLLFSPLKFLFLLVIPHQFAAWGIMGVNFLQHDGCDADHPYNHSRNFISPLENWFFFNNGYHGLHHIQPGLHWSLLPKVHAAEVHGRVHPALEPWSLFGFAFQAYVWPGRRARYDGSPVVLPAPVPDEPWFDPTGPVQDTELGAIRA